jgi:repressor LexA
MKSLSKRQRDILEFSMERILSRGSAPSMREIGEKFEITSLRGVSCHLEALERKRFIEREPHAMGFKVLRNVAGESVRLEFVKCL